MNQVTLCGRLTNELELKHSQTSDSTYTQFSLAINSYKGKEQVVEFFNIIAFGNKAEQLVKHVGKGCKLLIVGKLNNNTYTNEQGIKSYSTKVILEDFEFIEYKKEVAATIEGPNEGTIQ